MPGGHRMSCRHSSVIVGGSRFANEQIQVDATHRLAMVIDGDHSTRAR
jgi:hypothetical protein